MNIEQLREFYVTARNAVKEGKDDSVAIYNLTKLYDYVENLFERGSILDRVKSRKLYEALDTVMKLIKKNGLKDATVLKFFGLKIEDIPIANPPKPEDGNENDDGLKMASDPFDYLSPVDEGKDGDGDKSADDGDKGGNEDKAQNPDSEAGNGNENPYSNDKADEGEADGSDGDISPDEDGNDDPDHIKAPETLDDFIGQAHIVARLKKEIAVAKQKNIKHLQNILLFGGRGLGKSTLMQILANELGVRFEWIDASQFQSSHTSEKQFLAFLQNISNLDEPVLIGIDEIHALPGKIQSSLLTLLQSREFVYMDKSGHNHRIPIKEFTFVGATTDPQDVLPTIKDRCKNLTFYMQDYTHDELMLIFKRKFASKKLKISEDLIEKCIPRCRCSIREVEAIVIGLLTETLYIGTNTVTNEILEAYFKERGVDEMGLEAQDIEVLRVLASDPTGTMSADTLASKLGIDVKVLLSEYEPYLLKIDFISVVNRGRYITDKGRAHLKKIDGSGDTGDSGNTENTSNDNVNGEISDYERFKRSIKKD